MMLDELHAQYDRRRNRLIHLKLSLPNTVRTLITTPNYETNEEERLSPNVCPISGYEIKNLVILDEKS